MRDCVGSFALGDFNVGFGNERTSDRCAEHVLTFVDGISTHHRINKVTSELFDQIDGVVRGGTSCFGFFCEAVEFFFLADIGCESDNFSVIVLLEPADEDGGIETTRVCEYDFHRKIS